MTRKDEMLKRKDALRGTMKRKDTLRRRMSHLGLELLPTYLLKNVGNDSIENPDGGLERFGHQDSQPGT